MRHLSDDDVAIIKARILRGDRHHDIAADYRINQGRVSDLKHGRLRAHVRPAILT